MLLYASMITAVIHWQAQGIKNRTIIVITKPLMMMFLISWVIYTGWFQNHLPLMPLLWFVLALVFGLGGDIFLLLPGKWFPVGLGYFLLGHICTIIGFGGWISTRSLGVWLIPASLALLAGLVWMLHKLFIGLTEKRQRTLRGPVTVYALALFYVLFLAASRLFDPEWSKVPAALVTSAAFLFLLSDSMNAWHRFVFPIKHGRVWIMVSYHLAQLGFATGIIAHLTHGWMK